MQRVSIFTLASLYVHGFFKTKSRADALLILLAVVAIASAAGAVYWILRRIEAQVKQQTAHSLQTVVATTQEGFGQWIDEMKNPVSVIASRAEVISAIQIQRAISPEPELLRGTLALHNLRTFLSPVLRVYKYDFSVVDSNRIQIATQNDLELGTQLPSSVDPQPIESALNGKISFGLSAVETGPHARSLIVAAPVRDPRDHIIAALVFFLDPKEHFNVAASFGRIGTTGETYVFDRSGRMLTASRFRTDRSLYVRSGLSGSSEASAPLTRMATSALSGKSGVDVDGYRDYRDVEVFGAWIWDPVLNVGIASEIDASETLIPYRSIRTLTFVMLAVIGGVFAMLLVVLRRRNRILASNYAFQEAIRARQDTLAVVSHDLRAPLNNVLLCSNMISNTECDSTSLSRFTGMINRSSRQMEKLISDLLDVSEMEMGRLRIEKKQCAVPALLDPIKETFSESARSKSIELAITHPEVTPSLLADPDRIVQVLSNLVGNAIKFTPEHGKVAVDVAVLPNDVRFEVRDTGPGIPQESQPHVFEQFWKTRSSGKRGKGLGLYIAKMIVERHDGNIWIESDGQSGSTFFFTIPC